MLRLLFVGLLSCSCGSHISRSAGDQGIEGTVYRVGGNRMPAPNSRPSASPKGVRAVLYVYELTNISQVDRVGQAPYYQAIHTKLIQQAKTDDKGHFKVSLAAGLYSVFTKKGDLFYASTRDEKNNLAPVEVLPGKMTKVDCSVESDQKPVY
jgi:hypothetical protein